jgi:hypothetical protein
MLTNRAPLHARHGETDMFCTHRWKTFGLSMQATPASR